MIERVSEGLRRSAWQMARDQEAAPKALPGFAEWERSGEYSGGQVGFGREGRWWRRASQSEYRGEDKFGFRRAA